ncbi:hypothetical protein [Nocardia sp. NPDC127526]|uniref:hypothetical protein n=1 Tax=Nocardia sp. NPDC127526 TaxID=3345393 RepID=UPI003626E393
MKSGDRLAGPLRFDLGRVVVEGGALEQWQYEVTGGGRIWYAIDDERRVLYALAAAAGRRQPSNWRANVGGGC